MFYNENDKALAFQHEEWIYFNFAHFLKTTKAAPYEV